MEKFDSDSNNRNLIHCKCKHFDKNSNPIFIFYLFTLQKVVFSKILLSTMHSSGCPYTLAVRISIQYKVLICITDLMNV